MSYLKCSKEKLNEVLSVFEETKKEIDGAWTAYFGNGFYSSAYKESDKWADSYWQNHKDKADVSKDSYTSEKWDSAAQKYVSDFDESGYNKAVENGARAWIKAQAELYKGKLTGANGDFKRPMVRKFESIYNAFEKVCNLIETFEGIEPSLKKELMSLDGKVSEGGSFKWQTETIISEDGNETILDILLFSSDGSDEGFIKIAEAVNCSYTTMGVTSNYAIYAYESGFDNDKLFDEYMTKSAEKIGVQYDAYKQKGFFSVVSDQNIANMYTEAMGKDYDKSIIAEEYAAATGYYLAKDDDDLTSVKAGEYGSMAMAGAVLLAAGNIGNEELPDELKTIKENEKDEDKDDEKDKIFSDDSAKQEDKVEQLGDNEVIIEDIDGEGEEPIDGEVEDEEIEESDPELNPEEKVKIPDDVVKDIKDKIESNEDLVVSEEVEKPEITSDDIDNQARDKFYEEKTKGNPLDNELAQERMKAVEDYNNMSDDQKISALESLGYTGIAAAGLVADQAAGQTAYMIGLENQQLANISNDLAAQQGFMNHDTRYDDPIGMDYFSSGQASIDLTPVSKDVQVARTNLDQAKTQYDSSVTTANKAISDANASKEKYNNVLKNIRSTSGNNPKDWTEEQVKEYNKAAKEYNEAVDKANGAVKDANSKKADYAKSKEQYNVAYEKYREEAEKALQQVKENDNADEIGTSVGEPPLPSGDDLGDTFVVGDELVIGNVSSGEQGSENPGNNNDDPIPDQTGIVYEEE